MTGSFSGSPPPCGMTTPDGYNSSGSAYSPFSTSGVVLYHQDEQHKRSSISSSCITLLLQDSALLGSGRHMDCNGYGTSHASMSSISSGFAAGPALYASNAGQLDVPAQLECSHLHPGGELGLGNNSVLSLSDESTLFGSNDSCDNLCSMMDFGCDTHSEAPTSPFSPDSLGSSPFDSTTLSSPIVPMPEPSSYSLGSSSFDSTSLSPTVPMPEPYPYSLGSSPFDSTTLSPIVPMPHPAEAPAALPTAAPIGFSGCHHEAYGFSILSGVPMVPPPAALDGVACDWGSYDTTAAAAAAVEDVERWGCSVEGTAPATAPLAAPGAGPATYGWGGWTELPHHQGAPSAAASRLVEHTLPVVATYCGYLLWLVVLAVVLYAFSAAASPIVLIDLISKIPTLSIIESKFNLVYRVTLL